MSATAAAALKVSRQAVKAFGKGVVEREAIGGCVLRLVLHGPGIAALPARKQWQKRSRLKAAPLTITWNLANAFADDRHGAVLLALSWSRGREITIGQAGGGNDEVRQAPVKR